MLSKDEILKKKGKNPQQLDFVDNLDVNKQKNHQRLLLLLTLFLSIGTSIGFWIYREYRQGQINFSFSLPHLPQISTTLPTDINVWEICLFDTNNKNLLFSQNCKIQNYPDFEIKNNIDLIKSSLPNGLTISEQLSSASEINYHAHIASPKFSYLIAIKIYGSYPLDNSQQLIPKIINDLYWRYSQN